MFFRQRLEYFRRQQGPQLTTTLLIDLAQEKKGRDIAKLTFTARPVVESESGEISDIAAPEFQSYFLPMGFAPTTLLPIEPKYEVAVLDVTPQGGGSP